MKLNYIIIPLIVFLVAVIGSYFTGTGMDWYETINLPSWTPPGFIIGAVWTVIFILSAFSALIVWNKPERNWLIVLVFLINAGLNVFWSFLFFNQHLIGAAFSEAVLLDITVFILIFTIWPVSKLASLLLVPYALWTTFASFLTLFVWLIN